MIVDTWIHHVPEPDRLLLAWQAPDQFGPRNRSRWAVGEIKRDGRNYSFRYFDPEEFSKLNLGKTQEQIRQFGYAGYPAFRQTSAFHGDEGVLTPFLRRLPPRTRSDFSDYLSYFRVSAGTVVSDFALLGLTEAKLPSDGFSLVNPLTPQSENVDLALEVAGYRYYAEDRGHLLAPGQHLSIHEDPDKRFEPHAVGVFFDGQKIGNVNRLQAATFISWSGTRRISAVLERLNGTPDKPRAHMFVRVRPLGSTPA